MMNPMITVRDKTAEHLLAATDVVTIEMEFDKESGSFVTYVKELHGMSTFGKSETEALNKTAEMIRGYIKSMEANHKAIPLTAEKLQKLKQVIGISG
jgi:predicted RNase H-like HicB family nuclease